LHDDELAEPRLLQHMQVCAGKRLFYTPNRRDADSDGCADPPFKWYGACNLLEAGTSQPVGDTTAVAHWSPALVQNQHCGCSPGYLLQKVWTWQRIPGGSEPPDYVMSVTRSICEQGSVPYGNPQYMAHCTCDVVCVDKNMKTVLTTCCSNSPPAVQKEIERQELAAGVSFVWGCHSANCHFTPYDPGSTEVSTLYTCMRPLNSSQ
jgi:hypothetical protein